MSKRWHVDNHGRRVHTAMSAYFLKPLWLLYLINFYCLKNEFPISSFPHPFFLIFLCSFSRPSSFTYFYHPFFQNTINTAFSYLFTPKSFFFLNSYLNVKYFPEICKLHKYPIINRYSLRYINVPRVFKTTQ